MRSGRHASARSKGLVRADRLLSNLGICSRRQVKAFLATNRFVCEEKRIRGSGELVSPQKSKINNEPIAFPDPLYIAVHKPLDYVCSLAREAANNKLIYDLLPRIPTLSCAGRLDKFASGLVIMSQDGQFVNRILSPIGHAERVYEIEVEKPLRGDEPDHFMSGLIELRGEQSPLKPARMEIIDSTHCRYHQIRRMMATISNSTRAIHRVAVGPVKLGDLAVGKWRVLTPDEIDTIMGRISAEERNAAANRLRKKIDQKRDSRKMSRIQRGEKFTELVDNLGENYLSDLQNEASPENANDDGATPESTEQTAKRRVRSKSPLKLSKFSKKALR